MPEPELTSSQKPVAFAGSPNWEQGPKALGYHPRNSQAQAGSWLGRQTTRTEICTLMGSWQMQVEDLTTEPHFEPKILING